MRLFYPWHSADEYSFNPRTRDGCDFLAVHSYLIVACFNPRTRDGCDDLQAAHKAGVIVSIHAPVMGATESKSKLFTLVGFNPRTRDGCD